MKRRIMLDLAEDTTATHCGSCPCQVVNVCGAFSRTLGSMSAASYRRHPLCIERERSAANMVEIAREDAALVRLVEPKIFPFDSNGWHETRPERERFERVSEALRKHGGGA